MNAMRINRRGLLAGLAVAPLVTGVARAADTGPYPIETLFRSPALIEAQMSPDGSKIAILLDVGQGGTRDLKIEIIDAANPATGAVRMNVGAFEARWLRWAGQTRLLLGAAEESKLTVTDSGTRGASTVLNLDYQRVLSLPLAGGDPVALFSDGRFRKVLDLAELVAVEADGRHALFAVLDPGGSTGGSLNSGASMMDNFSTEMNEMAFAKVSLFRADLTTGALERMTEGEASTIRWEMQGANAVLRRDLADDGETESWFVKPPGADAWRKARQMSVADPDLVFLGPAEAPGVLWVLGRDQPGAVRSVRQWDLNTDTLAAPVSSRPGAEPAAVLIDPKGRFVLAEYRSGANWDGPDRTLLAQMKGLQAYFGASSHVRLLSRDETAGRLLVAAAAPNRPLAIGLFDPAQRKVTELASSAPWLDPARLADGTADADPVVGPETGPLVVMVRPAARDRFAYDFDPWAQAFAARGWRTLETTDAPGLEARIAAAGAPVAVVGWGAAGKAAAALGRSARARAIVILESPEADAALLGSAQVSARRDGAVEARDGDMTLLLLRPPPSRAGAGTERLVRAIFARDHIGGAAAANEAARRRFDRNWISPSAQAARCTVATDFIARALA